MLTYVIHPDVTFGILEKKKGFKSKIIEIENHIFLRSFTKHSIVTINGYLSTLPPPKQTMCLTHSF